MENILGAHTHTLNTLGRNHIDFTVDFSGASAIHYIGLIKKTGKTVLRQNTFSLFWWLQWEHKS